VKPVCVTISTNIGEAPVVTVQARKDEPLDVTPQERLKCRCASPGKVKSEAPLITAQAHENMI
jgi:hypothetical protein